MSDLWQRIKLNVPSHRRLLQYTVFRIAHGLRTYLYFIHSFFHSCFSVYKYEYIAKCNNCNPLRYGYPSVLYSFGTYTFESNVLILYSNNNTTLDICEKYIIFFWRLLLTLEAVCLQQKGIKTIHTE